MMRLRLAILLVAFIVTPALAQVMHEPMQVQPMQVQPIQGPLTALPNLVVQQDSDAGTKVMTIADAQARIAQLNREKRELNGKLTEALMTIDQWTKKGGSLVHAYCASATLSQRTDGAGQEDCEANGGYACSQAEGTCNRSCNVTTQCAGGYICDTCHSKCVSASAEPPKCE